MVRHLQILAENYDHKLVQNTAKNATDPFLRNIRDAIKVINLKKYEFFFTAGIFLFNLK